MLPKRKLIKKLRQKNKGEQQMIEGDEMSLLERLQDGTLGQKEEVLSILANLHSLPEYLIKGGVLQLLVKMLYTGNTAVVVQALFAISNMCELDGEVVAKLFGQGLAQALVQLPSSNLQLLKPILVLFMTISGQLEQKYRYLVQGIRSTLNVSHLKCCTGLVLQFLFRTKFSSLSSSVSKELLEGIWTLAKSSQNVLQKTYAICIVARQLPDNTEVQEVLLSLLTQLLVCTDLAKEYQLNFGGTDKKEHKKAGSQGIEQEEEMVQQQMKVGEKGKWGYFRGVVEGMEVGLEFVVGELEGDGWEEDGDGEEEQMGNGSIKGKANSNSNSNNTPNTNNTTLNNLLSTFLTQNMSIFPKLLSLSSAIVPGTQNITYLSYHLLIHLNSHSSLPANHLTELNLLIQQSLSNLFQSVKSGQEEVSQETYEVLLECLEVGVRVMVGNKGKGVGEEWVVGFTSEYLMENIGSVKLAEEIKPCFMLILQLFSLRLNPQTNPNITPETNFKAGTILKHLLLTLPYTSLQQFRCQVLDTLFDVYSNQSFDKIFIQLGFIGILQNIIKNLSTPHTTKNTSKQTRKKQKFINDVIKDVKRFLQYKYKMIKF